MYAVLLPHRYDRMLDKKGNTAVYLLYAGARIANIIAKAGIVELASAETTLLADGAAVRSSTPSWKWLPLDGSGPHSFRLDLRTLPLAQ